MSAPLSNHWQPSRPQPESVVLSTCNRSEIYVAGTDSARAREEVIVFLGDIHQLAREAFLPHLFSLEDTTSARHLFRVSAGLDSMVLGETADSGSGEGRVHAAGERRANRGLVLNRTFHGRSASGSGADGDGAGEGAVSVGFAAVALARKIFGELEGRNVRVVGAGEMGSPDRAAH